MLRAPDLIACWTCRIGTLAPGQGAASHRGEHCATRRPICRGSSAKRQRIRFQWRAQRRTPPGRGAFCPLAELKRRNQHVPAGTPHQPPTVWTLGGRISVRSRSRYGNMTNQSQWPDVSRIPRSGESPRTGTPPRMTGRRMAIGKAPFAGQVPRDDPMLSGWPQIFSRLVSKPTSRNTSPGGTYRV